MQETVDIPPELVWDYPAAPDDLLWRLQRLADWFPAYGRDRRTVALLYEHLGSLRAPPEVRTLIGLYEEAYRLREGP
jgi:hypothetical protein